MATHCLPSSSRFSSSFRALSTQILRVGSSCRLKPIRSSRNQCPTPLSPMRKGELLVMVILLDRVVLVAQNPARRTMSAAMVYAFDAPS